MAAQILELKASLRPRTGKGSARQARRDGRIPAVIYGDTQNPEAITLEYNELWKQMLKGRFTATVFDLDLAGKRKVRVIPRAVQVEPVKDLPVHVDFIRIGKEGIIQVAVPVKFLNESLSPGLKRGGILNIVRHEIEVYCPYERIPTHFEANLEGLDIGRSIHISAIAMPADVKPVISKRDFTVATIAGVRAEEEVAPTAEAAAAEGVPAEGEAKAAAPAAGAAGGKGAPAAAATPPAAGGKAAGAPAAAPPKKK